MKRSAKHKSKNPSRAAPQFVYPDDEIRDEETTKTSTELVDYGLEAYRRTKDTRDLWGAYIHWCGTGTALPKPLENYFFRVTAKLHVLSERQGSPSRIDFFDALEISRSTFSSLRDQYGKIASEYFTRFREAHDREAAEQYCADKFKVSKRTVRRAIRANPEPDKEPKARTAVRFYLSCRDDGMMS